mmetsp:Transcript_13697/g.36953  ORF Transcript_13697/g.36953 Transcript_13697/m.36953 type:complete len:699 (+) Transcript_13697:58-2154(+)
MFGVAIKLIFAVQSEFCAMGARPGSPTTVSTNARGNWHVLSPSTSLARSEEHELVSLAEQETQPSPPIPTNGSPRSLVSLMRRSVVRITSIVKGVDWFRPYIVGLDDEVIGSGFAVKYGEESSADPIFVTNAQGVLDAHTVVVQMPSLSQRRFLAYAPLIVPDFDIALVRLQQPAEFLEELASLNVELYALEVNATDVVMGDRVAAFGFPPDSSQLKLSSGLIAGAEFLYPMNTYQSTVPVSRGSSGGPLFKYHGELLTSLDYQLVGVVLEKSTEGQNINFIVPETHIRQALFKLAKVYNDSSAGLTLQHQTTASSTCWVWRFLAKLPFINSFMRLDVNAAGLAGAASAAAGFGHDYSFDLYEVSPIPQDSGNASDSYTGVNASQVETRQAQKLRKFPHRQLRIAPVHAKGVESNEVLYNQSGGCRSGFYLTMVPELSAFNFAEPQLKAGSFLIDVDGVPVDSHGMGRAARYFGNKVPYQSIMVEHENIDDVIKVQTCSGGLVTEHMVPMSYAEDKYNRGIKTVLEPSFTPEALDFEIFAGMTFMEMTTMHANALLKANPPTALSIAAIMVPEKVVEPRLVITDLDRSFYASRVLRVGTIVASVNGQPVSTLKGLRARGTFSPKHSPVWRLKTESGNELVVDYKESLQEQVLRAASDPSLLHQITPAIAAAFLRLTENNDAKKHESNVSAASTSEMQD